MGSSAATYVRVFGVGAACLLTEQLLIDVPHRAVDGTSRRQTRLLAPVDTVSDHKQAVVLSRADGERVGDWIAWQQQQQNVSDCRVYACTCTYAHVLVLVHVHVRVR